MSPRAPGLLCSQAVPSAQVSAGICRTVELFCSVLPQVTPGSVSVLPTCPSHTQQQCRDQPGHRVTHGLGSPS